MTDNSNNLRQQVAAKFGFTEGQMSDPSIRAFIDARVDTFKPATPAATPAVDSGVTLGDWLLEGQKAVSNAIQMVPNMVSGVGSMLDPEFAQTPFGHAMQFTSDLYGNYTNKLASEQSPAFQAANSAKIYDDATGEWHMPTATQAASTVLNAAAMLPAIIAGGGAATAGLSVAKLPSLIGGIAKLSGAGTKAAAKLGLAGDQLAAARLAAAARVGKVGTGAAGMGVIGGAAGSGDAYNEAYGAVLQTMRDNNVVVSPEDAHRVASTLAREAAIKQLPISILTNAVGLGGAKAATGGIWKRIAKGALIDAVPEVVEEGGQGVVVNATVREIDPSRDLMAGVRTRAALGLIAGGVMGGGMAGFEGVVDNHEQRQLALIAEGKQRREAMLAELNRPAADIINTPAQPLIAPPSMTPAVQPPAIAAPEAPPADVGVQRTPEVQKAWKDAENVIGMAQDANDHLDEAIPGWAEMPHEQKRDRINAALAATDEEAAVDPAIGKLRTWAERQAAAMTSLASATAADHGIQVTHADLDAIGAAAEAAPAVHAAEPAAAPKAPETVLQNRDRSSSASIEQMQSISQKPDYLRLASSNSLAEGAPVVFGDIPATAVVGKSQQVATSKGDRIPVQYAAVEADDLVASHNSDGTPVAEYANGVPGKLRAIAGNGRVAGLKLAYSKNRAGDYAAEMAADDSHGISADAIKGMRNPVLVRVMPADKVTPDIGDVSNTSGTATLSPAEMATNDIRRIDLQAIAFDEDGEVTEQSVMQFIQSMPIGERAGLMDGKRPARAAYDRLNAAIFAQAYGDPELIRLYAQAADGEAKNVMRGLAIAAPHMARLEGAGDLDIRPIVAEAATIAVNAGRKKQTLAKYLETNDPLIRRDSRVVAAMFVEHGRSAKTVGERLSDAAKFAHTEATKSTEPDMFGDVQPKATREDVTRGITDGTFEARPQSVGEPAGSVADGGHTVGQEGRLDETRGDAGKTAAGIEGEVKPLLSAQEAPKEAPKAPRASNVDMFAKTPEEDAKQRLADEIARLKKKQDANAETAAKLPDGPLFDGTAQQKELGPTEAQKEAGNYKKEHVRMHGLDIAIENPRASVRSGKDENGKEWSNTMAHDYGYIKRTIGADEDHVDVFIGPNLTSEKVFVVNQTNKSGKFDEHKVMMGFSSEKAALEGYLANYDKGWDRYSDIVPMSIDEFKSWLKVEDQKKPAVAPEPAAPAADLLGKTAAQEAAQKLADIEAEKKAKQKRDEERAAKMSDGTLFDGTAQQQSLPTAAAVAPTQVASPVAAAEPVAEPAKADTYQTVLAEREERAKRFGREKIIEETKSNLAGMVLGRNFGESVDDFFASNPYLSEKRRAYTDWLSGTKPATPADPVAAAVQAQSASAPTIADEEKAIAILDAADVRGKERLDAISKVRSGEYTLEDLEGAYPAKAAQNSASSEKPEKKPDAVIGDFGEKIGGARKDVWSSFKDKMQAAEGLDIAAEPLSKTWPAPDYQALLDGGADPWSVAFMHAVRDEIPTKPKKGWKLKSWVSQVEMLRDLGTKAIDGRVNAETVRTKLADAAKTSRGLTDVAGRAELYQLVGHEKSLAGVRISSGEYSLFNGVEYKPPKIIWSVEKDAKATAFSNWPRQLANGDTRAEAIANFKAKYSELEITPQTTKGTTFEVYSKRGEEGYWVGKKVGRNPILLKGGFASAKEARAYKDAHNDELVKLLEKHKEIPRERRDVNNPRVGEDHRAKLGFDRLVQSLINRGNVDAKRVSDALVTHSGLTKASGLFQIPSESALSRRASGMDAKLNQSPAYMAAVNIELLRNLNDAGTLSVERFRGLDVPSKRVVLSAVLSLGHDAQVARGIVQFVPVDVMNLLTRKKIAPDDLLRDDAMLSDLLAVNEDPSVAAPDAAGLAFVRAIAGERAKVSGAANLFRVALEQDPAVLAGEFDSIPGKAMLSHDVTPDDFQAAFSFKGVQFGNWVDQKKRQKDLNDAFDALMDMAAVIGVTPKALSLNGELGLAFGARGKGGVNAAAAHFERDFFAINLTKNDGAGSLGHEWWHSLDNYFSRMRGKSDDMMTGSLDVSLAARGSKFHHQGAVRKEMIEAYGAVLKAINDTNLRKRSGVLDGRRSKEYWTTPVEMSARTYESYLIAKLQDQGASNDYLANIVDEETWRAAEELGFELENSYPYPLADESPVIRAAFDQFFQTIETKETDKGVALFKMGGGDKIGLTVPEVQKIVDGLKAGAGNLKVVADFDDLPQDIRDEAMKMRAEKGDIKAAHHRGTSYLVASNLSRKEVQRAVFHEVFVHGGLRNRYGMSIEAKMISLASKLEGTGKPSERVMALAKKQDINLSAYVRSLNNDTTKSNRQKLAILTEELLAHMGETTGSLRAYLEEIVGAIRQFMRDIGLADLADLGVTDLRNELRLARKAVIEAEGNAGTPSFSSRAAGPETGGIAQPGGRGVDYKHEIRPLDQLLRDANTSLDLNGRGRIGLVAGEWAEPSRYRAELGRKNAFIAEEDRVATAEEGRVEQERLIAAAKENGFFIGPSHPLLKALTLHENKRGMEHDAYIVGEEKGRVVIRSTLPGSFGHANKHSPAYYLKRIAEYNQVFPNIQVRLIGVGQNEDGSAVILTAQAFVAGKEYDTEAELDAAMRKQGWFAIGVPAKGLPARYQHKETKAIISDVHVGNILHIGDELFPIDVIVEKMPKSSGGKINEPPKFSRVRDDDPAAGKQFIITEESLRDAFIRRVQDKFNRVKTVQRTIEESAGQKLPDYLNVYQQEELTHGKSETALREFEEKHVYPLIAAMSKAKVTRDDLDEYLYAQHAKERNDYIAEINPTMPDGGSGMSYREAAELQKKWQADPRHADIVALAARVYAINEERLNTIERAGLESPETIAQWRRFEAYVPLKGTAEKSGWTNKVAQGFSVKGKESKQAMGRNTRAESPLLHAIGQTEQTLLRAEKNHVAQSFLKLVDEFPNADLWEVIDSPKADLVRRFDKKSREVEWSPNTNLRNDPDVFVVKVGGVEKYIRVYDERLLAAMKNLGPEPLDMLSRTLGRVNRFLAMINTSLNPEFVISNFARDIQTAIANLETEYGRDDPRLPKSVTKQVIKDVPAAVRGIYHALRKTEGKQDSEWVKLFNEFREDGGQIGFFGLNDYETKAAELQKRLNEANGDWKALGKKGVNDFLEFIMDANSSIENATRLAAYKAARDVGVSRQKAASLAKNLTVNFNRKGELGTLLNSLYLFANASIQGTAQLGRVMTSKKGRYLAAGISIAAVLLAELNRMLAGDDDDDRNFYDKVPDYVKERNLIVMKWWDDKGGYMTLPLPYGYNIFNVAGNLVSDVAHGKPVSTAAVSMAGVLVGAFSPLGSSSSQSAAGWMAKLASPTILDPALELAMNENFAGHKIYNEGFPYATPLPESALFWRSTSEVAKWVAESMNVATGGSDFRPGGIDVSPDSIEYLFGFATGGAGGFATRILDVAAKLAEGEDIPKNKIPFARKVSAEVNPKDDIALYYDRRDSLKQIEDERGAARREGGKAFVDFQQKFKQQVSLLPMVKATDKQLKQLRDQRKRIDSAKVPDSMKRPKLQQIDDRIKVTVDRFNKRYGEVVGN